MAIKFIPSNTKVSLEGQKEYEGKVIDLLNCMLDRLGKVEEQLSILTDEEID